MKIRKISTPPVAQYVVQIIDHNDESHLFAFKKKEDAVGFVQECMLKHRHSMKSCEVRTERLISNI